MTKTNSAPRHDSASTTAMILAGGFGTRLRTVVNDRPKVLAEVHGRPFLEYLLDQLADAGVKKVVLCTGYMADLVEATLGSSHRGMRLAYSVEEQPLGTGGALRLAAEQVDSSTILAMNGDSYCDADLSAYFDWHRQSGFSSSLLLTDVDDTARYGRVNTTEDGRVTSFEEKGGQSGPGWINAGIYLFDRSLIDEIEVGRSVSLERDMLPDWITRGLGGFECPSRFLDIGLPESYAETASFFEPRVLRRSA